MKFFLLSFVCLFSLAALAEDPQGPVVRDMSGSMNAATNAMNNSGASLTAEQQEELQKQLALIKANTEESEKLMKEMDAN